MAKPIFGQEKKPDSQRIAKPAVFVLPATATAPKHHFAVSPGGEPGHSYLCEAYKTFFAHAKPYMEFMLNELKARRAPANVMQWIRNR